MYEVGGEISDEKETLKDDIAAAKAKLASNDTEIFDAAVTTTSN
jgi:hypothetical protein